MAKQKKNFRRGLSSPPTHCVLHLPWVESFSLPLTPLHTHFLDGVQSFVVFFMASLRGHALTQIDILARTIGIAVSRLAMTLVDPYFHHSFFVFSFSQLIQQKPFKVSNTLSRLVFHSFFPQPQPRRRDLINKPILHKLTHLSKTCW